MNWITKLFSSSVGTIVEKLGNAIDANVTSDEERLALTNELVKIQSAAQIETDKVAQRYEEELTKRHVADMTSDSWLSRNIRPLVLAYMIAVVSLLAVTDGNVIWGSWSFVIKDSYIDLFQVLLMAAVGFYFSSRGLEKVIRLKNK